MTERQLISSVESEPTMNASSFTPSVQTTALEDVSSSGSEESNDDDTTIAAAEIRQQWSTVVDRVARKGQRVVVERRGSPLVAVISAEDFQRFQQLEAQQDQQKSIADEVVAALHTALPEVRETIAETVPEVINEQLAKVQGFLTAILREAVQREVRNIVTAQNHTQGSSI